MTSNAQKKWYEGLTAEEIEAVFAERERKSREEALLEIEDEDEDAHEVCDVCDECITCGGCGCDDDDDE